MSRDTSKYFKFGSVTILILLSLAYLAYTGVQDSKSYYVTIKELRGMGDSAYTSGCAWLETSRPVRSSVRAGKSISSWWRTVNS